MKKEEESFHCLKCREKGLIVGKKVTLDAGFGFIEDVFICPIHKEMLMPVFGSLRKIS